MRTRLVVLVALALPLAALAGSERGVRDRIHELEAKLGSSYLELWRETHEDAHLVRAQELGSPDAARELERVLAEACRREEWTRATSLLIATAKRRPQDLERARGVPL